MASTSADTFLQKLESCRLFTPEHLNTIREWVSAGEASDRKTVLKRLVERNWCTRWQAEELYAGRYDFYVGGYKLLEKLGAGGRGTVFKANHPKMNRVVALKVMAKELVADPEAVARFRREVESAAQLNHPNVIAAYDASQDGDIHFLVMEHVPGRDLNSWLKEYGKLPINWASECMRQAALGLQHAHERGLVHRDIKPANIIAAGPDVSSVPIVKVLDFGCAMFLPEGQGADGVRLTQPWQTFGTPDYMAPEQAESARNADIRSDIFSLGCTFYKLLAGEVPYTGATQLQKLLARASHDAPPIKDKRADVPDGLAAILHKMLARKSADRYQTPGELAGALSKFSMVASLHTEAGGEISTDFSMSPKVATEKEAKAPAPAAPAPAPAPAAAQTAGWQTSFPAPGAPVTTFAPAAQAPATAATAAPQPEAPAPAFTPAFTPGPTSAAAPTSPAAKARRAKRVKSAALGGMFIGGVVGLLIGGAIGGLAGAAVMFSAPGDVWQIVMAAVTATGAGFGAGYQAAVASALAAVDEAS